MNILIVNPYGIGDVLFTTPHIHTLKDKFPKGRLGYLCNQRTAPLLKANPFVDEVIIYERDEFKQLLDYSWFKWFTAFKSLFAKIRAGRFDTAIDFSLAANFGFYLWFSGVKQRIGYNYKNRGFYLTDSVPLTGYHDKHIVEYYADILQLIGVKPQYKKLELYLNPQDALYADQLIGERKIDGAHPLICVFPGGGASWGVDAKLKRWPVDSYAILIDKSIEKFKAAVIILGDLSEKGLALILEKRLKNKAINLAGELTLGESAAVIGRSDLFIGTDGGPLHIAAASGKKTLSFFGPVDPKVYGPYPLDASRNIVLRKTLDCSPCYQNFRLKPCLKERECLENIDVGQALAAVDKLLG